MGAICTSKKNNSKSQNPCSEGENTLKNSTLTSKDKLTSADPTNPNGKENEQKKNEDDLSKNKTKSDKDEKLLVAIDNQFLVSKGIQNPRDVYTREKTLGQGSFGTVYLVKHNQLHRYFAMKVIKKVSKKKEEEENLMNEINILKSLDHANILKICDFYSLKNEYDIITEYCQEGELFDEIKNNAPFDETLTGWYMRQILSAVCYCHSQHIVHRDLKPENILIMKRMKNGFHPVKIIDFGTAKVFKKEKKENMLIGSAYYIAPEVLSRNYTEKCDIWSCGVIMYILLTGRPPFNGANEEEIMKKIQGGTYDMKKYPWGIISEEAKDLLKSLLQVDPEKRYTAEAALRHPWFESEKVKASSSGLSIKKKNLEKLLRNLTKYRSDNVLRCAVIAYLVHNSTQLNQAHDAIKLFNQIDKNGDGKISREELVDGLQLFLKLSGKKLKEEVETIFSNIDTDHNDYIEYEEFVRAAIDKEYFLNENFLRFAFNYFDSDQSGAITLEEITNLFYQNDKNKKDSKAQEQLRKCFEEIDINGDGELSFDEFMTMMKNIILRDEQ